VLNLNPGGVQTVIMNNIDLDDNVIFDFVVQGDEVGLLEDNKLLTRSKIHHITSLRQNKMRFILDLSKILKDEKYEIVHIHQNFSSIYALIACKIAKVRFKIVHSHNSYFENNVFKRQIKKILSWFIAKYIDFQFGCSKESLIWLYGRKRINSNSTHLLKNAIDTEKFKFNISIREEYRKSLHLKDKIIIGHVGHFNNQKNHIFLIDVFKELNNINPSFHLILIGDGEHKDKIVKKVKVYGIDKEVTFLGRRNDVDKLYNVMDVFCLPSLHEGFPVVLVETQSNGLPCIISSNITDEVILTDRVQKMSLNDEPKKWANQINLKFSDNIITFESLKQRINCNQVIKRKGYDLILERKKLLNFYKELYKHE
jgi:glycosyltransferase EpsF